MQLEKIEALGLMRYECFGHYDSCDLIEDPDSVKIIFRRKGYAPIIMPLVMNVDGSFTANVTNTVAMVKSNWPMGAYNE